MRRRNSFIGELARNRWLYIFLLPALAYFIIFHYGPMYGVQLAFKEFNAAKGIWGSPWVGFDHFIRFFRSHNFWTLIRNTLGISLYSLAVGFPIPILLALLINEIRWGAFKKFVQTVTYAPHFISVVVLVGMLTNFLHEEGIINRLVVLMGGEAVSYMIQPEWFKTIYVLSGTWQHMGWNSIIYLATLAGVSADIQEAARIDGASRLQIIWHVNIPSLMPTMVTLLILNMGTLMSIGFEKVYLMQNSLNMDASDIISTYVYRVGLRQTEYSFSTAVGLFNSVVNCILLVVVNRIAKKLGDTSLW